MIGLAVILVALAVGDLVAGGLAGEPTGRLRAIAGLVAGVGVGLIGSWWVGLPMTAVVLLAGLGVAGWLVGKGFGQPEAAWRWPRLTLGWLAATLIGAVFLTPLWPLAMRPGIENWISDLPFGVVEHLGSIRLVAMIGVMLFLTAPANSFVRGALTVAGTDWRRSQKRLRGGRIIGVLERWLIFALATVGEPTAAALVVSAKSLLRFPELTRVGRDSDSGPSAEVDIVTEYFLLGSLLSWTLALAPALILG